MSEKNEWKLAEVLRESLLWTASSLAAVGKEQDVIVLEGRKRTIGEILDEANAALDAPTPASVAPGDAHPDDIAVDRFAAAMKAKLAQKRAEGRGGWDDKSQCSQDQLSLMLRAHVAKGDPVDVGNFAMMLHQRGERVSGRDDALRPAPAAGDALDAARYRWLRNHPLDGLEETTPCIRAADNDTRHWALRGEHADAAIDFAMQQQSRENK